MPEPTDRPAAPGQRGGATRFEREQSTFAAHRIKGFSDGVVAIALTLLILPLMESVTDVASEGGTGAEWLAASGGHIGSFVLSFVLIASAWLQHHRLFARVEVVAPRLLTLTVVRMLTIVWLPVPTAMVGQMQADALQKVLYIGTLTATSVALAASRWYLARHPRLHDIREAELRSGRTVDAVIIGLYLVALVVAVSLPGGAGYFAMFTLFLAAPIHALVERVSARRDEA